MLVIDPPKNIRGLNPNGLKEVRISSVKDMERIKEGSEIAILSRTLGKRKRIEIIKYAEKKGLKFK